MRYVLVFFLGLFMGAAHAQQLPPDEPTIGVCLPLSEITATLKKLYGEEGAEPSLVERTKTEAVIFVGPAGSLTVVEVFPDGTACYRDFNNVGVRQGQGWGTPPKHKGNPA
jgi:hypothetical protein